MKLQLPTPLKRHIHETIRHGSRHRRYVMTAFLMGAVVSLLEVACTGQVYGPTILFMVREGHERMRALALLGLYNLAFVAPLVFVFVLACLGLSSEKLIETMRRNAALTKFATASLFLLLFVLLLAN